MYMYVAPCQFVTVCLSRRGGGGGWGYRIVSFPQKANTGSCPFVFYGVFQQEFKYRQVPDFSSKFTLLQD